MQNKMTVKEFLAAGHLFVDGDEYKNPLGQVCIVGFDCHSKLEWINNPKGGDCGRIVVSAKCLEGFKPDFKSAEQEEDPVVDHVQAVDMKYINWDDAPEGAERYSVGSWPMWLKHISKRILYYDKDNNQWVDLICGYETWMSAIKRPFETKEADQGNTKYDRVITGKHDSGSCIVDVYRVMDAFNVTNPQLQHAGKKMLNAGLRGHKDTRQDLVDIRDSAQSALDMFDDNQK